MQVKERTMFTKARVELFKTDINYHVQCKPNPRMMNSLVFRVHTCCKSRFNESSA